MEDYFDCTGVGDYDYYEAIIDELEEACVAVTVSAISTVTAILVAIAAALN